MGNTPSVEEVQEYQRQEQEKSLSNSPSPLKISISKVEKSPGFFDKFSCTSASSVVNHENSKHDEESAVWAQNIKAPAHQKYAISADETEKQYPCDEQTEYSAKQSTVIEKSNSDAYRPINRAEEGLKPKPLFVIYPGMPDEVKKIVEEFSAKLQQQPQETYLPPTFSGYQPSEFQIQPSEKVYIPQTVSAHTSPDEGFVTPHVTTNASFAQVIQTPNKRDTFVHHYESKSKEVKLKTSLDTPPRNLELPFRHYLINSINETLRKSPEKEHLLHEITADDVKNFKVSPSKVLDEQTHVEESKNEQKPAEESKNEPAPYEGLQTSGNEDNDDEPDFEDADDDDDRDEVHTKNYKDGSTYEGQLKQGKPHGKGRLRSLEDIVLEGVWEMGKLEGFGRKLFSNGEFCYVGEFRGGKFNGRGVLYNETPQSCEGPLNPDNINNLTEVWTKYEGEFTSNLRNGAGTIYFTNGEKFEGRFERDQINGEGAFYNEDGDKLSGVWKQGKLQN